ncbi:MAG: glycine cleavage T-protein C-barrel [Thermoleophilia bacterium]|nr:glycine cleavage T-protein C-barrel [Thermoleophilia bacterium]
MNADGSSTTAEPLTAAATIDALKTSCVVRWWQVTQFVEVAGPDAVTFLSDLCTQAVDRIELGTHRLGLQLDVKARIVAAIDIFRSEPRTWIDPKRGEVHDDAPRLLLELLPDQVAPLIAHLTKYRLRARLTIEPVEAATIAVVGARALEAAATLGSDHAAWFTRVGRESDLPQRTWVGEPAAASTVVEALVASGLGLAAPASLEAARICAGTVSLHDMLPGRMPAEVGGVDAAVALDAGCYLGQEPVVRLHFRGKANRTLRRVTAASPIAPSRVDIDGGEADGGGLADPLELIRATGEPGARPVGRLTTWSELPDGSSVGFAMLRREVDVQERLRLVSTPIELTVVDAPIVPLSEGAAT